MVTSVTMTTIALSAAPAYMSRTALRTDDGGSARDGSGIPGEDG
jgi:hypothetical protein